MAEPDDDLLKTHPHKMTPEQLKRWHARCQTARKPLENGGVPGDNSPMEPRLTKGMRITGSEHRAANILARPEFAKLSNDQATQAVNSLAESLERMGMKWPNRDPIGSAYRLQEHASKLFPDVVPTPKQTLAQIRGGGSAAHEEWLAKSRAKEEARQAEAQARIADANKLLASMGLPANPWTLPHRQQADAFEAMLKQHSIPYQRTTGAEGSRYYDVPTGPDEEARRVRVRFADHANTSRMHDLPDYNITTGDSGNPETGDHSLDDVVRSLTGWTSKRGGP